MSLTPFDPAQDPTEPDVVVIGGGAAGLAGALQLSRQRRSVLVLDAGQPRNAPAAHMHGYLGLDGTSPLDLLTRGREEVEGYGGLIRAGRVAAVEKDERFTVTLADGAVVRARQVLVATGLRDGLPEVTGLAQRWGRDVIHCPYCHGYEVRDQQLVVLATSPMSTHQALLFRQLTDRVTLIEQGAGPDAEQRRLLAARGIEVVEAPAEEILVEDDRLTGVRLRDGRILAAEAVVVATVMTARIDFLAPLGLLPEPMPMGTGSTLPAEPMGATAVAGLWAAGNARDASAQVGAAMAQGAMAGAQINAALVMEEAQRAADSA